MPIRDDGKIYCCYCGKWLVHPLEMTTEHLVPLSKGGSNKHYNKAPCCNRCNNWRGNKRFDNWIVEIKEQMVSGNIRRCYNLYDLEVMIENIEYVKHYVVTAGGKLKR